MSKEDVSKARDVAYDSGLRLARAKVAVNKAQNALQAARAEQDIAGVEYEQATRKAVELEAASIESEAKGGDVRWPDILPSALPAGSSDLVLREPPSN